MPYIDKELVSKIRQELKDSLPGFKLSVRREHFSSIYVEILSTGYSAFKPLNGQYQQVNHYYISDHYKDNPGVCDVLLKINEICNQKNGVKCVDSDYGTVSNYYVNIHIGQWDKPFLFIQ